MQLEILRSQRRKPTIDSSRESQSKQRRRTVLGQRHLLVRTSTRIVGRQPARS